MRPIVRIIDVKANGDKIELTKEQLEDIIKQAYEAGIEDAPKLFKDLYPNNPLPPITVEPRKWQDWDIRWGPNPEIPCINGNDTYVYVKQQGDLNNEPNN